MPPSISFIAKFQELWASCEIVALLPDIVSVCWMSSYCLCFNLSWSQVDTVWPAESDKIRISNTGPETWEHYCLTLRTSCRQIAAMTTSNKKSLRIAKACCSLVVEYMYMCNVAGLMMVLSKVRGGVFCPADDTRCVQFLGSLLLDCMGYHAPFPWWTLSSQVFWQSLDIWDWSSSHPWCGVHWDENDKKLICRLKSLTCREVKKAKAMMWQGILRRVSSFLSWVGVKEESRPQLNVW